MGRKGICVAVIAVGLLGACSSSKTSGEGSGGRFEARGLIAPAVAAKGGKTISLSLLGFAVPKTAREYAALPLSRKNALLTALSATDCAHPPAATSAYRIGCTTGSGPILAVLSGPTIVDQSDVASARALAPDVSVDRTQWVVSVTFTTAGQQAWALYTTAHNIAGSPTQAQATTCSDQAVPCADFVAMFAGDRVVSLPINISAITEGPTQISNMLTETDARKLAAAIAG